MNKKAFLGTFFFAPLIIIIYVFCWVFIFGPVMAEFGTGLAQSQGMTGFEGLIWSTLNIWAGALPLLAYIIWIGYGGGE